MDADDDGRWLTFTELAGFRGIDRQSARRLASRQKWRRQKDNHGTVRVYVPASLAERHGASADVSADIPAVVPADVSRAISALEGAVCALREQLDQANRRAEVDTATIAGLNGQIRDLQAQLEAVRQCDATRRALGRLARLRAAWRGE